MRKDVHTHRRHQESQRYRPSTMIFQVYLTLSALSVAEPHEILKWEINSSAEAQKNFLWSWSENVHNFETHSSYFICTEDTEK